MALLIQTTLDEEEDELVLVYKLSGDADAQWFVLRGIDFKPLTDTQVHMSRYLIAISHWVMRVSMYVRLELQKLIIMAQ